MAGKIRTSPRKEKHHFLFPCAALARGLSHVDRGRSAAVCPPTSAASL
nr:MAG TPA: hypothetical protein [Caudoviricetes sp.]